MLSIKKECNDVCVEEEELREEVDYFRVSPDDGCSAVTEFKQEPVNSTKTQDAENFQLGLYNQAIEACFEDSSFSKFSYFDSVKIKQEGYEVNTEYDDRSAKVEYEDIVKNKSDQFEVKSEDVCDAATYIDDHKITIEDKVPTYARSDNEILLRSIKESEYPKVVVKKLNIRNEKFIIKSDKLNEENQDPIKNYIQSIKACEKEITEANRVTNNNNNNDDGNNRRRFKCSQCSYSSIYKGNVKSHIIIHSSDKRFKCCSCSYRVNYSSSVTSHEHNYPDHNMVKVNISIPASVIEIKLNTDAQSVENSFSSEVAVNESNPKTIAAEKSDHSEDTVNKSNRDTGILEKSNPSEVTIKKPNIDVNSGAICKFNDQNVDLMKLEEKQLKDLFSGMIYNVVLDNSDITYAKKLKTKKTKKKSEILSNKPLLKSLECPYTARFKSQIIQHNLTHWKNETYSCRDCPFTAKCLYLLKQHKKDHTEKEIIACMYCPFTTNNKTTYLKHKVKHIEPKKRVIQCVECSFTANSRTKVQMHSLIHKSSIKIFQCEDCSFATTNNTFLKEHVIVHNKPEEGCFRCSECSFTTNSDSSLTEHDLTHERKLEIFRCRECSFATFNKLFLLKHKRSHKPQKRIFRCHDCPFKTKKRDNLMEHSRVHMKQEIFECSECPFKTTFKLILIKHKLTHLNAKNDILKCPECHFKTTKDRTMRTHILTHVYSSLYRCRKCEYSSNYKGKLKLHMLTHKTVITEKTNFRLHRKNKLTVQILSKSRKNLKCFRCEYICMSGHLLNQHMLTHLETKCMKCEHCDYETKYKGNMVKHVLTHVNEYIVI